MPTTIAMPPSDQLPKVKGPEINDRDLINDILSYEKYMSHGFGVGLNEMQMPKLHQAVNDILNDVHKSQFELFDVMFQNGWYKMKAADQNEIQQAYQQFNGYKTQFPQQ
jgi:spore coat protein CotF